MNALSVKNITYQSMREQQNDTRRLVWFTGLSGSGKSLANAVEQKLHRAGVNLHPGWG